MSATLFYDNVGAIKHNCSLVLLCYDSCHRGGNLSISLTFINLSSRGAQIHKLLIEITGVHREHSAIYSFVFLCLLRFFNLWFSAIYGYCEAQSVAAVKDVKHYARAPYCAPCLQINYFHCVAFK